MSKIKSKNQLRAITPTEIEDLLDFIKPNSRLPVDVAEQIVLNEKNKLRKQLTDQKIKPQILPILKEHLESKYHTSLIQAGESVGIITAQSIGERQTQSTLNSFHSAGITQKTVVTGVPRFQQLMNAAKTPAVNYDIFFKKNIKTIQDLREIVNHEFTEFKLSKISTEIVVKQYDPELEPIWYKLFSIHNKPKIDLFPGRNYIYIKLNLELIYEYKLDIYRIVQSMYSQKYKDLLCYYSPTSVGEIHVYVDENVGIDIVDYVEKTRIHETEDKSESSGSDSGSNDDSEEDSESNSDSNSDSNDDKYNITAQDLTNYYDENIIPEIEKIIVCGIPDIRMVFFTKNDKDEWYIETEGGKYGDILAHPNVNNTRSLSNNMWDIYNILGVEATRNFLIDEFMGMMEGINACHPKLLVEKMTFNGGISSINRYSTRSDDYSPLGKVSFEESFNNIINSAVSGEVDKTVGVSASIICGKKPRIGTNMFDVKMDVEKLQEISEEESSSEEEEQFDEDL